MPEVREHRAHVILKPTQRRKLDELAQRLERSRSAVLVLGLNNLYDMVIGGKATCATGQRCYVPHMHPPAVPVADLPGQTTLKES